MEVVGAASRLLSPRSSSLSCMLPKRSSALTLPKVASSDEKPRAAATTRSSTASGDRRWRVRGLFAGTSIDSSSSA